MFAENLKKESVRFVRTNTLSLLAIDLGYLNMMKATLRTMNLSSLSTYLHYSLSPKNVDCLSA
jgi:hypothetical protein